ncbi:hypothetical protein LBMAG42_13350 [Deltaproteobacteria bacterium]|nr:hypothetical protein LBMAG42_13350 [Deltaproteobacteria bacterium]
MMKSWLVYLLISQVTQNPLLGILAVALLWYGGGSWWFGRMPDLAGPFRRWKQEQRLRETLRMNPHDTVARCDLAGLVAHKHPTEAKELLSEVLRRYPDNELAHYWLGIAQLQLGETDGGRASIDEALRLRRELRWGEPAKTLGDHYLAQRRPAEALVAYRRAIAVHGSFAEAWYKAGVAARATGDEAEAKGLFQRTLSSTEGAPPYKRRQDRLWRWRAWWALRR